ncbi:hypothetical protein WJX75_001172 [Coccomyxa subellipsoidea]|uniref:Uncharacterized protein n=1 Tax=Coccomyxa subellipsoidea TaxID=248742 RepID=A0ABR2YY75_9CHLO
MNDRSKPRRRLVRLVNSAYSKASNREVLVRSLHTSVWWEHSNFHLAAGSVPGLHTLRVSLVDKCGDHLLHYPVIDRDGSVDGPVIAVAKCKQGTAAWQSFHCSHLLRSDLHPDRVNVRLLPGVAQSAAVVWRRLNILGIWRMLVRMTGLAREGVVIPQRLVSLSRNSQAMPESSSARPPRLQSTFAQPQGNGVRAEQGSGASPDTWDMGQNSHGAGRGGGFRVQCARPGCGAVMHVQPEQLGLEPVTLERVELEPVSRAEVLGSDPALLSETLGAPSFKQHWDLTFVKSRLEHKFCAWHHARLARLDAVHALLLVVLSSTSMLWPLRSAGTVLPVVPFGVQGVFLVFGVALLYMRGFWSGYAQHREQLASAERLVAVAACMLPAMEMYYSEWQARRQFVRDICKVHID